MEALWAILKYNILPPSVPKWEEPEVDPWNAPGRFDDEDAEALPAGSGDAERAGAADDGSRPPSEGG